MEYSFATFFREKLLFMPENYGDLLSSFWRRRRFEVRLILATLELPREQTASTEGWQDPLRKILNACSSEQKLGIVGVGHPMRGDDYAGSYALKSIIEATETLPEGAYLFDAEDNVEALISGITRLGLKHLVFIDACEMARPPGNAALLSVAETSYPFFTTHGIPLKVLAERLFPDSEVWILAIQPKQTELDSGLSPEIRDTATNVSEFIVTNLAKGGNSIAG